MAPSPHPSVLLSFPALEAGVRGVVIREKLFKSHSIPMTMRLSGNNNWGVSSLGEEQGKVRETYGVKGAPTSAR